MMFYREADINKNLKCKRCLLRFSDPKIIVPCLKTLCANCVDELTTNDGHIDCFFCQIKHKVPTDGFKLNEPLAELLKLAPNTVYRSPMVKQLKEKLDQMSLLSDELVDKVINSTDEISSYCSSLRNQIDLVAETRIEEVNALRADFLKQVNDYEKECMEKMKLNIPIFNNQIDDLQKLKQETDNYLSEFEIDDQIVKMHNERTELNLVKLKQLSEDLKSKQFNGKLLIFKANETIDNQLLGSFNYDNFPSKY